MATITLKGNTVDTCGELPLIGATAPNFTLVQGDLSEANLETFAKKTKILNIFPSVDTDVCASSVRHFNEKAAELENIVVLNISADLPFAQNRFCGAEGIQASKTLSSFRSSFSTDFGVKIVNGPLQGLCSRAIIILDENNKVIYTEQVAEITDEPNYDNAYKTLKVRFH
ncbi:MAG: thiol peroxidase [Chlamydiales bacterium]|jgi:thiol peroxidase